MAEPEDLTFKEFKALVFALGNHARAGSAAYRLYHFLKSGCTEAECKRWIALHLWDFEPEDREVLTMLLAADALHSAAKNAEAEATPLRDIRRR